MDPHVQSPKPSLGRGMRITMCLITPLFAGSGLVGAGCIETVTARGTTTLVLDAVHGTIVGHTRRGRGVGQVVPVERFGARARAHSSHSVKKRRAALRRSRAWNYLLRVVSCRRRSRYSTLLMSMLSLALSHEAAAGTAQPQTHSGQ